MKKQNYEFAKWMGPLLECLREVGGSAKPRDLKDRIAEKLHIPDETREETLKSGSGRFNNQVAWARQYLVWEGLIDGSRHGLWTLTDIGSRAQLSAEDGNRIVKKWLAYWAQTKRQTAEEAGTGVEPVGIDLPAIPPDEIPEVELLSILRGLSSSGFERICQRLLHESGFEQVVVTGKPHDGGIDGYGTLRINAFVSFKVVFQCKKYKGTVRRAEVGDFRNTMIGRADKGIFITTGTFSPDAIREASREGAPPVELVDGEKLVAMFESVNLGVRTRTVYEVDQAFFEQFRDGEGNS